MVSILLELSKIRNSSRILDPKQLKFGTDRQQMRETERETRKARERRVNGCECPKKESGLAAASTTPNLLSSSRTATVGERKESSRIGMGSCLKIQRGKESIVRTYAAVWQRDLWMLLAKGSCVQVGLEVCGVLSSLSHNQICPRLFISLSLSGLPLTVRKSCRNPHTGSRHSHTTSRRISTSKEREILPYCIGVQG
jgi:hypothetical protein